MKKLMSFVILLLLLVFFFYPKQYVIGGLVGEVGPGSNKYKEEYSCFGVKQQAYSPGCCDNPLIYNCYGITYGKKCYVERYLSKDDLVKRQISKETAACK